LLASENGTLIRRDLWIDEVDGVILDAQRQFYETRTRPVKKIDLKGNILSPGYLDIQINGAYGFDFSVYDGDREKYEQGLDRIMERVVETGVTSLVPTIITQEKSLYPTLLGLLGPRTKPGGANLIGWHAEGPFLQMAKRGAHDPKYIIEAKQGLSTFEEIYGSTALVPSHQLPITKTGWENPQATGVRIITVAPEVSGVREAIAELVSRGLTISIGHSVAGSREATDAIKLGARLITHLFNAMPVLHHRDPGIVGLLGASPAGGGDLPIRGSEWRAETPARRDEKEKAATPGLIGGVAEALQELPTPPRSPKLPAKGLRSGETGREGAFEDPLEGELGFDRPFYEIIVDGVHSHPNSVRLAYMSHKEGCILITDAMHIMDPHLKDGTYDWRDGRRFIKEGVKLYLEGSDTLAGSVISMDICVRNFAKFTGCGLAQAVKCATFNPAKCLGIENKKGSLRAGADADLIVLDREGNVLCTWVAGKKAWGVDF